MAQRSEIRQEGNNIFVAFFLLLVLLFSAVLTILIDSYSAEQIFGPILTYEGNIREVPALFLILLMFVFYIIAWGYLVLFVEGMLKFTQTTGQVIKLLGTFFIFSIVGLGVIFRGEILFIIAFFFSILFLYAIFIYIRLSSTGIFNTMGNLPITKKWSLNNQSRVLLVLSLIMLIRVIAFDISALINILEYYISTLTPSSLTELITSLHDSLTTFYNSLKKLVGQLNLDFLYPLSSTLSTLESLIVKFIVYSTILLKQLEDIVKSVDVGDTMTKTGVSAKVVGTSAAMASADVVDVVGVMIDEEEDVSHVKDQKSLRFWKWALGILVVFFIEGLFILIDLELESSFKPLIDFLIAFCVWLMVFSTAQRVLRSKGI